MLKKNSTIINIDKIDEYTGKIEGNEQDHDQDQFENE